MTVREIAMALKCGRREVKLAWNGTLKDFDPEDRIDIDAYGRYEVDHISVSAYNNGEDIDKWVEIEIAMAPVVGKEATV